jgi:alanine racemase
MTIRALPSPITLRHAAAPARAARPAVRLASTRTPAPVAELTEALVDLEAVAANTRWFADRAAGATLLAVVKADAFGHGAVPVASAALSAGAGWLGVARLREGLALRAAGMRVPVLGWLLEPAWLRDALDAGIDVSASSVDDLDWIADAGATRRPEVHLKLDTGLHRAGAPIAAWPEVVAHAADLERRGRLHVRGIWSHLSHGDVPGDPRNGRQQEALAAGRETARSCGLAPELTHLANTGGVIQLGTAGCSMVRVGAGLYGIDAFRGQGEPRDLRPAMTVSARVIGMRNVPAGEGIGYGHETVTRRATRLALVAMGYADGVPRIAGGRAWMLVGGVRAPVVGRISMDQVILDVTGVRVRVGDAVTVFGDGADGGPTALDWAEWTGTIPHEVLTGIGGRVPRRFVGASA